MIKSMAPFDLATPVEPWVVVARDGDRVAHEQVSELASIGVVRRLDSTRMIDAASLLDEFAEKLEFPSYFGRNWYALVDCLDDLHGSWHGGRPVVVVVEGVDALVDMEFFPLFIALLCEAAVRANLSLDADGLPRGRPSFPLHFVFFVEKCDIRRIVEGLSVRDDILTRESGGRLLICSRSN